MSLQQPRGGECRERLLDPGDDHVRLVLLVRGVDDADRLASWFDGLERAALEPLLVARDEPAGGRQDVAGRAAVLEQGLAGHRHCGPVGGPHRRHLEAFAEALKGGVAGAPEAVDRLVVVTDHDDVVGLVRAAADQLEQQDLGHVGVLELVHQHVPELGLVAAHDVRTLCQQLDRQAAAARRNRAALARAARAGRSAYASASSIRRSTSNASASRR